MHTSCTHYIDAVQSEQIITMHANGLEYEKETNVQQQMLKTLYAFYRFIIFSVNKSFSTEKHEDEKKPGDAIQNSKGND